MRRRSNNINSKPTIRGGKGVRRFKRKACPPGSSFRRFNSINAGNNTVLSWQTNNGMTCGEFFE